MDRLLERKTTARPVVSEEEASATQQLLSRRASRAKEAGDDPFPFVASLPPKTKPPTPGGGGAAKPGDEGYTNRLLEAKRRAKDKDL